MARTGSLYYDRGSEFQVEVFMEKASQQNKAAWEYRAYEYLVKSNGEPSEYARVILEDPAGKLKKHYKYFKAIEGKKIGNPCGSAGRRAVALSVLGADVTVFDISEENMRYAMELAESAGVELEYVVGDIYDIDEGQYGQIFDMLYLEGGILHYFHDLDRLMSKLHGLLKPGGEIVLNDFHPFRKVVPINFFESSVKDYFETGIHQGDVAYKNLVEAKDGEEFPECSFRYYTISEVMNSMIAAGFQILGVEEEPSWTDPKLPGEMTIHGAKR